MVAIVEKGTDKKLGIRQYDKLMVYDLPRRVSDRVRRKVVTDAVLAGCRYYIPTAQADFLRSSPLVELNAEEYLLARLPSACTYAADMLNLPPAKLHSYVFVSQINHCCEQTVLALAAKSTEITLVTGDTLRAHALTTRLYREIGLPVKVSLHLPPGAKGVLCAVGDSSLLPENKRFNGRVQVATDLFEVDFAPPCTLSVSGTILAGMLYSVTRARWLTELPIKRLLLRPGQI